MLPQQLKLSQLLLRNKPAYSVTFRQLQTLVATSNAELLFFNNSSTAAPAKTQSPVKATSPTKQPAQSSYTKVKPVEPTKTGTDGSNGTSATANEQPEQKKSLFGDSQPATKSIFGDAATNNSIFGNSSTGGGKTEEAKGTSLFAGLMQKDQGKSLFGGEGTSNGSDFKPTKSGLFDGLLNNSKSNNTGCGNSLFGNMDNKNSGSASSFFGDSAKPLTGMFSNAANNTAEDDGEEAVEGDEDEVPGQEIVTDPTKSVGNYKYDNSSTTVLQHSVLNVKVDSKPALGAGTISVESLPNNIFMLIFRNGAKIILHQSMVKPGISRCDYLKERKDALWVESGEIKEGKLVRHMVKIQFSEETSAAKAKQEFEECLAKKA